MVKKTSAKILSFILVFMMLFSTVSVSAEMWDEDDERDPSLPDYYYKKVDGGIHITHYYGNDQDLVIPTEIDGYKVVGLANYSMIGQWGGIPIRTCDSITIPSTIRYIGECAFDGTQVDDVLIEEGLESIDEYAFAWCYIKNLYIPTSVTYIADNAFDSSSLSNVYYQGTQRMWDSIYGNDAFPDSTIIHFDNSAYVKERYEYIEDSGEVTITKYIGSESSAYVPEKIGGLPVTAIGGSAFRGTDVDSVVIPDSVKTVGAYAFADCKALRKVELYGVVKFGEYAWSGCEKLDTIFLPWVGMWNAFDFSAEGSCPFYFSKEIAVFSVPDIDILSFIYIDSSEKIYDYMYATKYMREVIFCDNELRVIGDYAFKGARLEYIELPEGLEQLGTNVFENNESLEWVTIPKSIKQIGAECFKGATSLTDVYFNGSEEQWNEIAIDENNLELFGATIHFLNIEDPIPDEPVEPEIPEEPTPDEPVEPEIPEEPTPDEPVEPETPEEPTPDEPVEPEIPEEPTPDEPVEPEIPEEPTPDEPVEPEIPEEPTPDEPVEPETPEEPTPDEVVNLVGDADGDGVVSVKDVTFIQKYLVDLVIMSETTRALADVNGNGMVNIIDATAIQKWLADIDPGFDIGANCYTK